ncbi:MAG: MBL fold metallo-hydrolase [Clostridia bacterium]|nr:MBL fold metallo-hydrolase [Clostridia bacterium]
MTFERIPVGAMAANCCLVYDEQKNAAVIDPGDEPELLLARIQKYGLTVRAILLTHVHFDHIQAVKELQAETCAPLLVHEAEVPALTDPAFSLVMTPYHLTADRVLHDGDTVEVGELTFTVLHTPGHTDGSVCYWCGDTLFSGDTLFAGSIGRTDFAGGDFTAMRKSLARLAALPDDIRVIPGHGPETTIGFEKRHNPFVLGM